MNLLCLVPSYHGVQLPTVSTIRAIERECWSRGHGFDMIGVPRMIVDLARAELMAKARAAKPDAVLWLDDDNQFPAEDLFDKMLPVLSDERPMITAPYRTRRDEMHFCIESCGKIERVAGLRVQRCTWGGLGIVLMQRRVLDVMHKSYPNLQYESPLGNGEACAIFASAIVDRKYCLDDKIFFKRAAKVGLSLWASVDIETIHDWRIGNYGQWVDSQVVEKDVEKGAAE